MDLSTILSGSVIEIGLAVLAFIAVLSVIVFVHEYGHFKTARLCGVNVDTFSVGFGRSIAGFHDRHGTYWKIGWLPLGGYVKFAGDANAASTPDFEQAEPQPGDFHAASVWRRAVIVAAGPIANFILAIGIFAAIYTIAGVPITQPKVAAVTENSAAAEAGFEPGDLIKQIDGRKIESFSDVQRIVSVSAGAQLQFVVERSGEDVRLVATPRATEVDDGTGRKVRIGLLGVSRGADQIVRMERLGLGAAIVRGTDQTWFIITRSLSYLKGVILGRESADQLSGPIRIAQVAGEAASVSLLALVHLAAVLSVSIGLINLFPIPMLDGGHLLYYAYEAVRGKPLGPAAQELGFKVGFAVVIALMIFATWNDLS